MMEIKKHPLKNGMILIAFGVCLYTLLQTWVIFRRRSIR